MTVKVNKEQCMGCGNCVSFCPKQIIKLSDEINTRGVHYAELIKQDCISCGTCELMCTAAAIHDDTKKNCYELIIKDKMPPHVGCSLGSLAKALADVIVEMDLAERVVLFKLKAADLNMQVESYDYTTDDYFKDGLLYKQQHPDKLVIIICTSYKEHTTAINENRYRNLANENITLINTQNWFEADEAITHLTKGGSHILEELMESNNTAFIARSGVSTPAQMNELKRLLKLALKHQSEGKGYSIVEMVFPCFYRLAGRPQTLMSADRIEYIKKWFNEQVDDQFTKGILKQS